MGDANTLNPKFTNHKAETNSNPLRNKGCCLCPCNNTYPSKPNKKTTFNEPTMAGSLNVVFLFGLLGYVLLQGHKQQPLLRKGLLLVSALWLVNFGFSVFASPIALRFQLFPIIISFSYASLFIEYIIKAATQHEIKSLTTEAGHFQMSG